MGTSSIELRRRVAEHRGEQVVLLAEVLVDALLVDARAMRGDAVDAGAGEPVLAELRRRGVEEQSLRALRVPGHAASVAISNRIVAEFSPA